MSQPIKIITALSKDISRLRSSADIILEEDENVTYFGFAAPGTMSENEEKWSIMKIVETNPGQKPNKILFQWAKGQCAYNLKFSEYATYAYFIKKF